MSEIKKITAKKANNPLIYKAGVIAIAAVIAGIVIPVIHTRAVKFEQEREKEKQLNQAKSEIYINQSVIDAESGDFAVARKKLLRVKPDALNNDLQTKWYTAMTSIYHIEAQADPKNRFFLVMSALNFAEKGKHATDNQEALDNLSLVQAKLFMMNKQWMKAAEILQKLEVKSLSPTERWKYRIDTAYCYHQNGMLQESIKILTSVVDETDDEDLWAESMRKKSDLLWEMSGINEKQLNYNFDPEHEYLATVIDSTVSRFKYSFEALKGYKQIVSQITINSHTEKMKALEKILEIHVSRGEVNEAYFIANQIKKSAADRPHSAAAYRSMAELELSLGQFDRAKTFIDRLVKLHGKNPHTKFCVKLYYKKIRQLKDWDKLFELAKTIIYDLNFQKLKMNILRDLQLGSDNLLANVDLQDPQVTQTIQTMLDNIEPQTPNEESIYSFSKGSFYFVKNEFYKADVEFSSYLSNPLYEEFIERSHYFYLLSAVKSGKPAVLRSLRAKLYLNNTFHTKRSQDVMLYLMSAYYDMGLWTQSIDAAMKVFVNEIVRMGQDRDNYQANPQWLKAVARIGQSYEKTNKSREAEKIFSTWSNEFLNSPHAAAIYEDWAELASQSDRNKEALRRYNIVMPYLKEPKDFLKIVSLRNIQKLRLNITDARKETSILLKRLKTKRDIIGPQESDILEEKIYIALLEFDIRQNHFDIEETFNQAFKKYPTKKWPYKMATKWLNKLITNKNYKKANVFIQSSVLGPLSALKEDKVKEAIEQQVKLLLALENDNVF